MSETTFDDPTMTLIKASLHTAKDYDEDVEFSSFAVKRLSDHVDQIEAHNLELECRIAKAKDLLNAEMGMWRSVPTGNLPDHFIQLRQVLDVLDGGGE